MVGNGFQYFFTQYPPNSTTLFLGHDGQKWRRLHKKDIKNHACHVSRRYRANGESQFNSRERRNERELLVSLDGSKAGESPLSYVEDLIAKLLLEEKVEVTLIQVVLFLSHHVVTGFVVIGKETTQGLLLISHIGPANVFG